MGNYYVGIDLGTTNTVLSYIDENIEKNINLLEVDGSALIPSIIALDRNGEFIFGKSAKKRIESSDGFAAYYKLGMLHPDQKFPLGDNHYSAEELSTLFLGFIRKQLFDLTPIKSDNQIKGIVISKPAAFTQTGTMSTFMAAQKAGFKITKDDLISEPVAACYHYSFEKDDKLICVYDLGGGTFDSTILDYDSKEVKSTEGSGKLQELGGRNFDECVLKIIQRKLDLTISPDDTLAYNQVLQECLNAKEGLTYENSVEVDFRYNDDNFFCEISLEEFEKEALPLVEETIKICTEALQKSNETFAQVDKILLIGGSTYMPIVQKTLKENFSNCTIVAPEKNIDTIVAIGAAKFAWAKGNEEIVIAVPSQHSFGLISLNEDGDRYINTIMIANGEILPTSYQESFKSESSSAKFYLTEFTGSKKMSRKDRSIDPKDNALSMMEIYTVDNINPKDRLQVKYTLSEGDVPHISVKQDHNNDLKWKSERKVDKEFLDDPISKEKASNVPVYIMVCVDLSGSMCGTPIENVKKYFQEEFIPQFKGDSSIYIGIMGVSDKSDIFQSFTDKHESATQTLLNLQGGETGVTNRAHPFDYVLTYFNKLPSNSSKYLLVLADGVWSCQEKAISSSKVCNQADIETIGIGFGRVDKKFIKNISSKQSVVVAGSKDLGKAFSDVIKVIKG